MDVKDDVPPASTMTLKYAGKAGKQTPEGFEGEPKDVLITSLEKGTPEQSALAVAITQTNEEKVEINSVV